MNFFKVSVTLVTYCFILSACSLSKTAITTVEKASFPYVLSETTLFELDKELDEISGLCYDSANDILLAVEDEHGLIYSLSKSTGAILNKDTFYKAGDYEGIAYTKEYIFVLKSSGTLYRMDKSNLSATPFKIKSFLNKEYNTEGVGFDAANNSLLICHKESTDGLAKSQRCVFSYDLQNEKMMEEPLIFIDREEILLFLKENYSEEYVAESFKKITNPELDYLHLGPSAIAVHPQTNDIYILSSKSKVLLVYDEQSKKLKFLQKLNKKVFRQPEGICFDKEANLYISNESKEGGNANLIVFPIIN